MKSKLIRVCVVNLKRNLKESPYKRILLDNEKILRPFKGL